MVTFVLFIMPFVAPLRCIPFWKLLMLQFVIVVLNWVVSMPYPVLSPVILCPLHWMVTLLACTLKHVPVLVRLEVRVQTELGVVRFPQGQAAKPVPARRSRRNAGSNKFKRIRDHRKHPQVFGAILCSNTMPHSCLRKQAPTPETCTLDSWGNLQDGLTYGNYWRLRKNKNAPT